LGCDSEHARGIPTCMSTARVLQNAHGHTIFKRIYYYYYYYYYYYIERLTLGCPALAKN
jgi:hypothetical protein